MLDEGADCQKVLTQLAAVKAAVDQVGLLMITDRLRSWTVAGTTYKIAVDEYCWIRREEA